MLMQYFDDYATRYRPYKNGSWCYEDGCIYRGLACLHQATGEARWLNHLTRLVDGVLIQGPNGEPTLSGYEPNDYNIDNIQPGRALLYLHEITGADRYRDAAALLIRQLDTHPRTHSGVYWHKLRYPWQVWLDGLYMGPVFQAEFGQRMGRDDLVQDAVRQVRLAMDLTFVSRTGLYAHAMDEARKQPWADPETGQSPAHWARAIGWLSMALVDLAEIVDKDMFAPLHDRARTLLAHLWELRVPGGLWLQVIDHPDLPGNYEESSASAMFSYACLKATRLGVWDTDCRDVFDCLTQKAVRADETGKVAFHGICEVAGLGTFEGRYRDGSAAYYLTEAVVADDAKGVGPLMMAASESLTQPACNKGLALSS